MKSRPLFYTVALLLFFVLLACGTKQKTGFAPEFQAPFSSPNLPSDPALVRGVLPNGFQYVLMENKTPKDRVSIHLNVFTGSVNEEEGEEGLAHFLEHMLFNGSENFKPGELVEYFQSIGMDFGGDANASTSFFNTVYDLSLPKGDKKHLGDAFLVIRDYAGGALLLEEEIDRERGVVLAEKRERDSVSYRTFKRELDFELPGSRLNFRFPIGRADVLKSADRELVKGFYDRWYRPDNMALVVVGDMDTEEAQTLIRQYFSDLAPRNGQADPKNSSQESFDISWEPHDKNKAFYHYEPESGKTQITIERLAFVDFEPETLETLKHKTARNFADVMFQNRLSWIVKNQAADFSTASAYSGRFLQNISMAAVQVSCEPDQWETSLTQLEKTLRQALEFGFLPSEMERVKADFISGLESDAARADTRKSSLLARSILSSMNGKKLFLSPDQYLQILSPFIQSLSLEEVNAVFREAWKPDHRLVLVSGNTRIAKTDPHKARARILNAYNDSLSKEVQPYARFESKSFPYLEIPKGPALVRQKKIDAKGLGITQVDFNNNIRLNLKKTDFKKGEFLFKVVFGEGLASQPLDLPGLAEIAESTVGLSGFKSMDTDQLADALAGKDVGIEFQINEAYFALAGSANPQDMELIFQLIHTYFKDIGFRQQGLDLAKTRYRQMYDALKRTPDGVMRISGARFLAGGRQEFGLTHPDKVDERRLGDVEAWLKPWFETSPIEVSIVGDFDPEETIAHAALYLGALGGPGERKGRKNLFADGPIAFPGGQRLDLGLETKLDKGMVRVVFPTDDYWDIIKTRKLSMLARVFSERLRKRVREALGASYSPYVYNNPSMIHKGYGVFHVVVNVAPESASLVHEQIKEIAREMVEDGIGLREVELVKKPLLNQLTVLRQNNSYWLNSVMADSFRHPEKLDWSNHMVSGYSLISPEDLSELARQYLKVEKSALILIQTKE